MTTISLRLAALAAAAALLGCACPEPAGDPAITELKLETLTKAPVEFADAAEVVMSRVAIPAGKTLPLHYHPGQEFLYLTAGSGTLHLRDADDVEWTYATPPMRKLPVRLPLVRFLGGVA